MKVTVKGRNVPVTDDLRERVQRRFDKVARQVSSLAVLEVELCEERNPANPASQVAEATLHLKGVTLRAKDASREMGHAINLVADDLAVQVKRHRDKRRKRREARLASAAADGSGPAVDDVPFVLGDEATAGSEGGLEDALDDSHFDGGARGDELPDDWPPPASTGPETRLPAP